MERPKVVIDTVIFIEYLRLTREKRKSQSVYRRLLRNFELFTTVINTFELYSGVRTKRHERELEDVLVPVKVLPFASDLSKPIGLLAARLSASGQALGGMDCLIAGICLEHKIPLVTRNTEHFDRVPDLLVVPAEVVEQYDDADAILQAARERTGC